MRARWIDNVKVLTWMRLGAALDLLFMMYWVFTDFEIEGLDVVFVPMFYFFHQDLYLTKKITILILPILMNISLWKPCNRSYTFIRSVLYAEKVKLVMMIVVFTILFPFAVVLVHGENGYVGLLLIISLIFFSFMQTAILEFKKEGLKETFKVEHEVSGKRIKLNVLLLCGTLFLLTSAEQHIQGYFPPTYAHSTLYKFNDHRSGNVTEGFLVKMSPNQEMLLVRLLQPEKTAPDLFIYDARTMDNITQLKTPVLNVARPTPAYTFTPDSKYIVVGKELTNGKGTIKFEVMNIKTGEADQRFTDPKDLLKSQGSNSAMVNFIQFDPSGKYFALKNEGIELWDYIKGELLHVDDGKGSVTNLTWLSDRSFFVIYQQYDMKGWEESKVTYLYEIMEDGAVKGMKKEQISVEIDRQTKELQVNKLAIRSNFDGEQVVMLSSCKNNRTSHTTNQISLWNVKKEKKILSLSRDNEIKDVQFYPDGKALVIFEKTKAGQQRIIFWDIEKDKEQRRILVEEGLERIHQAVFTNDGKRVFELGVNVNIVNLE